MSNLKLTRNQTFGQLYLVNDAVNAEIRIPAQNAAAFYRAADLDYSDIHHLQKGGAILMEGSLFDYAFLAG